MLSYQFIYRLSSQYKTPVDQQAQHYKSYIDCFFLTAYICLYFYLLRISYKFRDVERIATNISLLLRFFPREYLSRGVAYTTDRCYGITHKNASCA